MRMTIIERAYELAREGRCRSVADIAATLKREQFSSVDAHLGGSLIKKNLNQLIRQAQAANAAPAPAQELQVEAAE